MAAIQFRAQIFEFESWSILRLPKSASAKLPSRGLAMADGTLNGCPFQAVLEPDGSGSHWLSIDQPLRRATGAEPGVVLKVALEPASVWPEPQLPPDLNEALESNPNALERWLDVTTKARWDWIRWIRSTKNPQTRQKRIATACSMLISGKRRPCCFNRSLCTEPAVSKNGVLQGPDEA